MPPTHFVIRDTLTNRYAPLSGKPWCPHLSGAMVYPLKQDAIDAMKTHSTAFVARLAIEETANAP